MAMVSWNPRWHRCTHGFPISSQAVLSHPPAMRPPPRVAPLCALSVSADSEGFGEQGWSFCLGLSRISPHLAVRAVSCMLVQPHKGAKATGSHGSSLVVCGVVPRER